MRFVDLAFVKRLETAVALCGRECAEQAQLRTPSIAAAIENIAGGIAVFAGVDSPITQAVGTGLDGPVTEAELDRLEDFYFSRGAPVNLELCPFIHPSLAGLLGKRPYRLAEFSNVLVRELHPEETFAVPAAGVAIRIAELNEAKNFTRIMMEGFADGAPVTQSLLDIGEGFFYRTAGCSIFAMVDGELAGGAGLDIHDGIAVMAGASTLPRFRQRGAQNALLSERLARSAQSGCDLAMTITNPGTASQRNSERAGFRIVYTRTKLVRECPVLPL
jgi:ribosomal protein S18 acetylase RimI-like enzyme